MEKSNLPMMPADGKITLDHNSQPNKKRVSGPIH